MRTNDEGSRFRGSATREGEELDFSTFVRGAADDLQGYVRAQKRYLHLHVSERAAVLLGKVVSQVALFIALGFTLLFLNIALGFYLGERLASTALGFVCVAGLYLVLFMIFRLWWSTGGRDRFVLGRINDFTETDHVQEH